MRKEKYYQRIRRSFAVGILGVLILFFASLLVGRYSLSPGEVLDILCGGYSENDKTVQSMVVWDVRLPRVLLAAVTGAGLAAAGSAYQGIFHNYLVSPDLLGVSNGAGFGAALGMFLTAGSTRLAGILAFLFGLGSVALTYGISSVKKERSAMTLVLSGVIVSSVFNALIALIKLAADTDSVLPAITYWLMGSFTGADYKKCAIAGCAVVSGGIVLYIMRWRINVLSMGDEEARSLGLNPERERLVIIVASTFITAACVTVSGIVGWVGMVMPNIVRRMIGADHRYLIPVSAIGGAAFLMAADLGARSISAGEIPVGILTSLVGAPVFVLVFAGKDGKPC